MDEDSSNDVPEVKLMGELSWRESGGEPTSTRTFEVVVENDVNRGTEGVPVDADPPYPAVASIVTIDQIDQPDGVAGVGSDGFLNPALLRPVPLERFANVSIVGASVDWLVDLDNIVAAGSDQGLVTLAGLIHGDSNVTEWRWQIMDGNGLMIAQVPQYGLAYKALWDDHTAEIARIRAAGTHEDLDPAARN